MRDKQKASSPLKNGAAMYMARKKLRKENDQTIEIHIAWKLKYSFKLTSTFYSLAYL